LSLAAEVPHAMGLPGPPPGHRDGDRRFYRPKQRKPDGHVFQPNDHRTPVRLFRRGVLPGHVERRDRRRLLQAGVPPRNRARGAEAGGVGGGAPETPRPGASLTPNPEQKAVFSFKLPSRLPFGVSVLSLPPASPTTTPG